MPEERTVAVAGAPALFVSLAQSLLRDHPVLVEALRERGPVLVLLSPTYAIPREAALEDALARAEGAAPPDRWPLFVGEAILGEISPQRPPARARAQ